MKIALVIFITLALAGCALLSLHMGVIPCLLYTSPSPRDS